MSKKQILTEIRKFWGNKPLIVENLKLDLHSQTDDYLSRFYSIYDLRRALTYIHENSNTTIITEEHIVNEILKINCDYTIDNIPLKQCYSNLTSKELSNILYEVTESHVLKKCSDLWVDNKMKDAYDFFLSYKELFSEKIELSKTIIELKHSENIKFFGDVFLFGDIDPIELALYYSHNELLELIGISRAESLELIQQPTINKLELELKNKLLNKIRMLLKDNLFINHQINFEKRSDLLLQQYNVTMLRDIKREIENTIELHTKKTLAGKLYDVASEYNINTISVPFTFDFLNDTIDTLIRDYDNDELKEAILFLENEEALISKDLIEQATIITEQIFMLALEKGVKVLRDPININFDLDDVEDIVNNYSLEEIKATFYEIQKFEATKQQKRELFNTLETARKYLEGLLEENIEMEWNSYAPSFIKPLIKGHKLQDAYTIVLAKSKEKTLDDKSKKLIMDYRFDLEEIIFGRNSIIKQNTYFEEFKEYPFEEYVRRTVEAIILPHVEVLEKIEKSKGQIQFVDIWAQNFSDSLKHKIRERDSFKCVVCDEETNLHVHHKIPRKFGGVNHRDNLVTLCSSCHGAIETADFEHAYQKCMLNAIKSKTSLQKAVDTSKDIYLLKEEIKFELDELFVKIERWDQTLAQQLLQTMKKIEYVFES